MADRAAQQRRHRERRKQMGLCPYCPAPLPPHRYCCEECKAIHTARTALRRLMKRASEERYKQG